MHIPTLDPLEDAICSSAAPQSRDWLCTPLREKSTEEMADADLAELIRLRLAMERGRGWVLSGIFFIALSFVLALGPYMGSSILLGITAALTASFALGLGASLETACWGIFYREARTRGLSEEACRKIFDRATGAERMLDVMNACGREIKDAELARFVR